MFCPFVTLGVVFFREFSGLLGPMIGFRHFIPKKTIKHRYRVSCNRLAETETSFTKYSPLKKFSVVENGKSGLQEILNGRKLSKSEIIDQDGYYIYSIPFDGSFN